MATFSRSLAFGVILVCGYAEVPADDRLVRETGPQTPEDELQSLHVREGFRIELFASEPMINKPINLAVDSDGRLWVSSTVEYPYAAERERWSDERGTRVRDSRDAIKILEDTDGDGAADKVVDFADGLNIPTGVLPWHKPEHHLGCIAWSIPNIWYFADTTGDGKCDLREVLFGPLGYEKDTHGMCSSFRLGPDGWVYATHGFNNTSHFEAKDGSTLDLHSGNVFRFRPDGSRIELWSAGQVNPFGLCFDGRGNLYSADCHSAPVYQLLRGAVYPSFGKPHDGLGFGPTMIEHSHGSTGICGIALIDRGIWGESWDERVLIGNPVTSKVNLDQIEFRGSTPVAVELPDFITSDDPWFRPVDLCLADDGALYIADFYNRIIGHYEVPLDHPGRDRERGRIWRVTKTSDTHAPRPAIVAEKLSDPVAALSDESPFRRRAAAAQLQVEPELDAIDSLRKALSNVSEKDTHLHHALRLALREQLKLPGAFTQVDEDSDLIDIALAVPTPDAADFLAGTERSADHEIRMRKYRHIARNAEWKFFETWLPSLREDDETGAIVAIYGGLQERGVALPPDNLVSWAESNARRLLALRERRGEATWAALPHPDSPKSLHPWILQKRDCSDGQEAGALSSLRRGEKNAEQRTGILRSRAFPFSGPIEFWICGHRGIPDQPAHEKNYVRLVDAESGDELIRAYPPGSDTCHKAVWNLENHDGKIVRFEIVDGDAGASYAWLGVARIKPEQIRTGDFRGTSEADNSLRQMAKILKMHAPADLRDQLRPFLPAPPAAPPREISPEERTRLDELIASRLASFDPAAADEKNGHEVFKLHCAACHKLAGEGGLIGPQLNGIGTRGPARLAEDILDPNRNVDAHFYVTTLTLKDESVVAGFVIAELGEVLVILDPTGAEHRVAKADVATQEATALSLMPAAFDQAMSVEQFNDLLAWLLQQG